MHVYKSSIIICNIVCVELGNSDFEDKRTTVTFTAGQHFSSPFTEKITDDSVAEGTEQFNIEYKLAPVVNARQMDKTAPVFIMDNDGECCTCSSLQLLCVSKIFCCFVCM